MRRALKSLILLYPKTWRNRYENEFHVLLDDVSPTWRTLFDVLGGALKMQMKIWSPWKIVAAFALAGLIVAALSSLLIPDRYQSTSVINLGNLGLWEMNAQILRIESRQNLTQLILEGDLYKQERAHLPMEDIIEQMKQKDILIVAVPTTNGAIGVYSISFTGPDAAMAQRTTQRLAAQFLAANSGTVLDPASLPVRPSNPRRSRILIMGLLAGIILGAVFALCAGLNVWKGAAGLGIAGAIVGAVIGFVLPERFSSSAVIRYVAQDPAGAEARIHGLVAAVTTDEASLRSIVQKFNLYPTESRQARRLQEHLHVEPLRNLLAIGIRFDDRDRYTAQKVVGDVVSRLQEESKQPDVSMPLQLIDPPTLPGSPVFPNRPVAAGTGFSVGLMCAIMLGVWRHFKRSLPVGA